MSAWRVAVTRDEGDGGALAAALRRAGLEPVPCAAVREEPPLDPVPLARAAHALEGWHWLVVASARAVEALSAARNGRAWPVWLRSAAVGERTAAALRGAGAESVLTATRAGAAALLDALRGADAWQGRRVLLPRAQEGGAVLAQGLRGLGALVDEVVAYRTVPRAPAELAAEWRRAGPDAAVVASPSAAESLIAALGPETLRGLRLVVAIGDTTRDALERWQIEAEVPRRTDLEAAAALVAARLPRKEQGGAP